VGAPKGFLAIPTHETMIIKYIHCLLPSCLVSGVKSGKIKMTQLLQISIVESNNVKMMQFDENVVVYDAMHIIREQIGDTAQGQGE